jgi:hypothetical protein
VVVTQLSGPFGKVTIFNIYDDSKKREVLPTLATYMENEICTIRPTPNDHIILLGDFNAHHFLWEETRNTHLCMPPKAQEAAQRIIELLADYDLQMALPKDKPTLQSTSSGNWTRPDNVFCTAHTLDSFTLCNTAPRRRPPCTDHVPIFSILDFDIPHTSSITTFNFRDVDWKEFCSRLNTNLIDLPAPAPITSEADFQAAAASLTTAIKQTIEDKVPKTKPSPHAKRWWTWELTQMLEKKDELSDLSFKMRGLPNHPIHEEHRKYRNQVTEAIRKTKQEHWLEYLEEIDQQGIYTASKYVTTPYGELVMEEGRASLHSRLGTQLEHQLKPH